MEFPTNSAIRSELGVQFDEAIADAARGAVAHPEQGAPRSKNSRRWLVKGFPFAVIYRASETEVLIVAVAHQRKLPEYWLQRV